MKQKPITIDELSAAESRLIATEIIERELAKQDLPLPKDTALEFHIDALLETKPEILEIARKRVIARQDAYSDSLRAIGIEPFIVEAIDLDLEI